MREPLYSRSCGARRLVAAFSGPGAAGGQDGFSARVAKRQEGLRDNRAPEGRQGAVYGVDASIVSTANAIGPMLGATVAATWGLRAPFMLAAGAFFLAALMAWFLVPRPGQRESPDSTQ